MAACISTGKYFLNALVFASELCPITRMWSILVAKQIIQKSS